MDTGWYHCAMIIAPAARGERISLIDSLRGFALLGILLMNMPVFSIPEYNNPLVAGELSGANYWCWWLVDVFFEGSMRGIFCMLFGAGSFLLLSRLTLKNAGLLPADIYYRRIIYLILFGLLDAYVFLWFGDILFLYGLTALLFFPFRNVKPWGLVAFAGIFLTLLIIKPTLKMHEAAKLRKEGTKIELMQAKNTYLKPEQKEKLAEWTKFKTSINLDSLKKEADYLGVKFRTNNYFAQQKEITRWNIEGIAGRIFPVGILETLAYFFIGLAFFKWNILTGKRSYVFYIICGALGYGIGVPIRILYVNHIFNTGMDFSRAAEFLPVNMYQPIRFLITLGHISLVIIVFKLGWVTWLYKALANVGQMAFTNYLSQSLICTFLFFGYGFGLYGTLQRYQTYEVVAAIWVFQVIFSAVWMRYFLFGPLEWVWRSLTYWERQPLLRARKHPVKPGSHLPVVQDYTPALS